MSNDIHIDFAQSERAVIVAPAGCGKTELIAKAVGCSEHGRQLILTHTHAGVKSLKDRLRKLSVPSSRYSLETIASFALKYAGAFPEISKFDIKMPSTNADYTRAYKGAAEVLLSNVGKQIINQTYSGLYVDEYQDCTKNQHALVLALADELPCRIVGDPLQGIFDFNKGDSLIDWQIDVFKNFRKMPSLEIPYRWKNKNEELGEWLLELRCCFERGQPISVNPRIRNVIWHLKSLESQRSACFDMLNNCDGSKAILHNTPNQAHSFAKSLGGSFLSMEEVECKDLLDYCTKFEQNIGQNRVKLIIEFAAKCMSNVKSSLKTLIDRLERGDDIVGRRLKSDAINNIAEKLNLLLENDSIFFIHDALIEIRDKVDGNISRGELLDEMIKTLKEHETGKYDSLKEAAWHIRQHCRVVGRRVPYRCVTRTLLIKGLEFDNAVVVDADALSSKELYVALTRASQSLTILSSSPQINIEAVPM